MVGVHAPKIRQMARSAADAVYLSSGNVEACCDFFFLIFVFFLFPLFSPFFVFFFFGTHTKTNLSEHQKGGNTQNYIRKIKTLDNTLQTPHEGGRKSKNQKKTIVSKFFCSELFLCFFF